MGILGFGEIRSFQIQEDPGPLGRLYNKFRFLHQLRLHLRIQSFLLA